VAGRKRSTLERVIGISAFAIVLLLAAGPITLFFEGQSKMRKFKAAVPIGTGTNEIVRLFGKPTKVVPAGGSVPGPRKHFNMRLVPANRILYFYGRDGIPYFQVFYVIDTDLGKVTEAVVDNLWW
jgi:hypothetical protein